MKRACKVCSAVEQDQPTLYPVTGGLCSACAKAISSSGRRIELTAFLESLSLPILLMQTDPRQVYAANKRALALFGKEAGQVEAHRGGQVFDCIHSFSEAGCGKDVHCEGCRIKDAIVNTFKTGASSGGVSTVLEIRKNSGIAAYQITVSTEKLDNFALLRIDRFEKNVVS